MQMHMKIHEILQGFYVGINIISHEMLCALHYFLRRQTSTHQTVLNNEAGADPAPTIPLLPNYDYYSAATVQTMGLHVALHR